MLLFAIGFVRVIRFNWLSTKRNPNHTVVIKSHPLSLYGTYQNQTIFSISVRFCAVRFYCIGHVYPHCIKRSWFFFPNLYLKLLAVSSVQSIMSFWKIPNRGASKKLIKLTFLSWLQFDFKLQSGDFILWLYI